MAIRIPTVTRDSVLPASCGVNIEFSPPAAGETLIKLSAVTRETE